VPYSCKSLDELVREFGGGCLTWAIRRRGSSIKSRPSFLASGSAAILKHLHILAVNLDHFPTRGQEWLVYMSPAFDRSTCPTQAFDQARAIHYRLIGCQRGRAAGSRHKK
jgi:hypothetical protein